MSGSEYRKREDGSIWVKTDCGWICIWPGDIKVVGERTNSESAMRGSFPVSVIMNVLEDSKEYRAGERLVGTEVTYLLVRDSVSGGWCLVREGDWFLVEVYSGEDPPEHS